MDADAKKGVERESSGGALSSQGTFRSARSIMVSRVLGSVFLTAATFLLVKYLSKRDYGVYTAALAIVEPARLMSMMGLDTVALREAAVRPGRLGRVIGTLVRLRLLMAVVAMIGVMGIGAFILNRTPRDLSVLGVALLALIPFAAWTSLRVAFDATQTIFRLIPIYVLSGSARMLLVLVAAWWGAPLYVFALVGFCGELAVLLWTKAMSRHAIKQPMQYDGPLGREMLKKGAPLAYETGVSAFTPRVGIYVLDAYHSLERVAEFGVAVKLLDPFTMIAQAFTVSASPYLSQLAADGRVDDFYRFLRVVLVKALRVLVPLALVMAVGLVPVVRMISIDYLETAYAGRWLVFAGLGLLCSQLAIAGLVGLGAFRTIALMTTLRLVCAGTGAWLFVPRWGAEGAAIAMFLSETVTAVVQLTVVASLLRRRRRAGHVQRP